MRKRAAHWMTSEKAASRRVLQFAWRKVFGGQNRPKVKDALIDLRKHLRVAGDEKAVALAAIHAGLVSQKNIGALQDSATKTNVVIKNWDAGLAKSQVKKNTVRKKQSESFYQSWEWTTLRMKVLKAYGRRCMCCGATPEMGAVIQVDHVKPRSKYPELALDFDNMQVLCFECNRGKGNWSSSDYRPGAYEREQAAWQIAVEELAPPLNVMLN